jgi:hypothetical protein
MSTSTVIKQLSTATANVASSFRNMAGCLGATSAILLAISTASAQAATLSNGSLNVTIRDDNGAIDTVLFGGSDFYNPGGSVSDYGFQNGTNTSTFVINTTTGFTGQPVSVTSGSGFVAVSGTYTGGGANVSFTRTYSLVDGLDVLRITTNFVNNGPEVMLRYFDTFDPDQGVGQGHGFGTSNDVLTLSTGNGLARVGQAMEAGGLTVVMGSVASNATVASGSPFSIFNGSALNTFFSSPVDSNGAFNDQGTHVGAMQVLMGAGGASTFVYDQAYGTSMTVAQDQFIRANSASTEPAPQPVPEPISVLGLLAVGALGTGSVLKRKQQHNA